MIAFHYPGADERLREAFARAISQRWEGLVLKGCDDPYFSRDKCSSSIKLKKDYIPGLGDTADFVILGGLRNHEEVAALGTGKLWWSLFHIGCLENKDDVLRFAAKPKFRIVDIVDKHGISKESMIHLNRHGYFSSVPFSESIPEFDVISEPERRLRPTELFKHPFIVEIVGAGFDKPANAGYPRVLKIHEDHSFRDITNFQRAAKNSQ